MLNTRSTPLAVCLLALAGNAQQNDFPKLGLRLRLPRLDKPELTIGDGEKAPLRVWKGERGRYAIEIAFHVLSGDRHWLTEPEDATELWRNSLRTRAPYGVCSRFVCETYATELHGYFNVRGYGETEPETRILRGPFGFAPLATLRAARLPSHDGRTIGRAFALAGILETGAYIVELSCWPTPDAATERELVHWLERVVRYSGPVRDGHWTNAELRARWADLCKGRTDLQKAMRRPVRTEHYVILTDSQAGRRYGTRLERHYRRIQATFPFRTDAARRLMPVFLFKRRRDFVDATNHPGHRGYAVGDCFVTWYGNCSERVHLHEATHQIVRNRLRLGGGGSWFQEGLVDYVAGPRYLRRRIARRVVRGQYTPLPKLVRIGVLAVR